MPIGFERILTFTILLLTLATLVGLITRRLRVPYTVGLVLIGLGISLITHSEMLNVQPNLIEWVDITIQTITPEFILGLLVTPLIFEAAFHLNWSDLRNDLLLILTFAIPGVALTTLLVGGIVYYGENIAGFYLPISVALLFGAMMAATDPVSVVALFRDLGVPKRLQALLEGESLFNDGTSIVVFGLVFSIATASAGALQSSDNNLIVQFIADFLRVVGGGLLIGFILGWLVSKFISSFDDHLIETTLTIVLAFGAYLIAEELHVSGVLAVVMAGLVNGNIGPRGMSPTTHIQVINFWEFSAFISNSIIFLLIGLEIDPTKLIIRLPSIILAILAVLMARVVIVYGFSWLGREIPIKWKHVLFWGGLRGAISLVLALSLPKNVPWSTEIQSMAFAVVLFTILVQGFTMRPLIRHFRLIQRSEMREEYERRHARAVAARAAYDHLQIMYQEGLFSDHTWELLSPLFSEHSKKLADAVKEVILIDPSVEAEELDTARREALSAQRSALIGLLSGGVISEEIFSQLSQAIDIQLAKSQESWISMVKEKLYSPILITHLMAVVIQIQDVENAISALDNIDLPVTRLSSSGGFLGHRNVTLIIGLRKDQEVQVVEILRDNCRKRVEYVATPLEGTPFHLPMSTPITVGGATIFKLEVEHYEVI